jgi:predicted nucleic acid-binding protein
VAKTSRRSRRSSRASAPADLLRYIESSALVAALLEGDSAAQAALRSPRLITSELSLAEAARAIVRARATGRLSVDHERAAVRGLDTFARRAATVRVVPQVLARVGRPFPAEPVRTLDAIHLATLAFLDESPQLVFVVTRDRRVRENARAMGYAIE